MYYLDHTPSKMHRRRGGISRDQTREENFEGETWQWHDLYDTRHENAFLTTSHNMGLIFGVAFPRREEGPSAKRFSRLSWL